MLNRLNNTAKFHRKGWGGLCLFALIVMFSSCHSSRTVFRNVDVHDLVNAGTTLGLDIEYKDDWPLILESARWIGVPYRYAGNDRSGVDCSGLNTIIFNKVYGIQLQRRSVDQFMIDCRKVKKSKLKTGDLVFFVTSNSKKVPENINHTGIYLKDGKFIHSSISRGVVVDNLGSNYYITAWVTGGRVKAKNRK